MKKYNRTNLLYSLFFTVLTLGVSQQGWACTTIVVGKELTQTRSIIHAHNEDMGMKSVGRLWHVPAKEFSKEGSLSVPYVTINRPKKQLSYWASGNPKETQGLGTSQTRLPYDSVLVGMNERGVAMACNWAHSREKNREKKGIRRYAIRQLILERTTSSLDGVKLIGKFIESYGQADWGGLVYVLADPNEAWVIETTTNHWVAKKIKDREIWVTANRFRIGSSFDLSSNGLVENAIKQGWHDPKKGAFHFSRSYGAPGKMNQKYDRDREQRVLEMLSKRKGKIVVEDIFRVLRDRYEGTEKFTLPQTFEVWRKEMNTKPELHRAINTNITQSSSVALLRKNHPLGPVMWYAMATPTSSSYFPLYTQGSSIPASYSNDEGKVSDHSAWWTFRKLQTAVDRKYSVLGPKIRLAFEKEHLKSKQRWEKMEQRASALHRQGKRQASKKMINDFSTQAASKKWQMAKKLIKDLEHL